MKTAHIRRITFINERWIEEIEMNCTPEELKQFGWTIQRLIEKQDLSAEESDHMFRQILLNRQPDLQQGAFLAALTAKGETPQEIAGAWRAIMETDTARVSENLGVPLVENSGTGMDQLKTFNVSTAAAVVAAAGGACLARHGARALTSTCGTVDLLDAVGIDVNCEVKTTVESIQKIGIGLFNGMSAKVHPNSLARILGQIRFGSTLNIAASLASPCRPTHGLRGVYSRDILAAVADVMREIGYQRGMVVHGFDARKEKGMDEFSTIGESLVHEFGADGYQTTYTLAPEDVGLKRTRYETIAAFGNVQKESVRFLQVIAGTGYPECRDLTCFNSGAILYLIGKVQDIRTGVAMSREAIESGRALAKLSEWVLAQADSEKHGVKRYRELASVAGLSAQIDVD